MLAAIERRSSGEFALTATITQVGEYDSFGKFVCSRACADPCWPAFRQPLLPASAPFENPYRRSQTYQASLERAYLCSYVLQVTWAQPKELGALSLKARRVPTVHAPALDDQL
ncbi:unnamed protein product [Polarella glacialis]|uniref:Uncharacterized protein n=1 Tax=Polarella glacialis TaxID=89957 RepID=A0A813HWB6_POLGL|nr:unnamed protein product [Polarella glacialis]